MDAFALYSIDSASKDPRFCPIKLNELSTLQVTVQVLIKFEEADNYLDWTIGTHGIRITFPNEEGSTSSATYLPDFAAGRGDRVETIDALLRKGGFRGTITQQLRNAIKLTRYQTHKVTVTHDEYKKWIIDTSSSVKIPQ